MQDGFTAWRIEKYRRGQPDENSVKNGDVKNLEEEDFYPGISSRHRTAGGYHERHEGALVNPRLDSRSQVKCEVTLVAAE